MTPLLATYLKTFFDLHLPVQRGLSSNTILTYRDAIRLLVCFAADQLKRAADDLTVEEVDEPLVLAFLDHVEQERGCSVRTRNARLAAIRTLFGFIAREEPALALQAHQIRTIPTKRTEHKTIAPLEEKQMQAIFDAIDLNARTGIRDKALLLMLYNTGARVSELVGLQSSDLRLDAPAQVHLMGKGRKPRSCPLWPETVEAVQAYLKLRGASEHEDGPLFLNCNEVPLTRFGVRYVVRKYAARAQEQCPSIDAPSIGPHTIRHTTAMHLLRSGNEINMVSYGLGHADINTTHIYIELDMDMKRKMLDRTEPPRVKKTPKWQKPAILEWLSNLGKGPALCAARA